MIIDFHTHCFPEKIAEKSMNILKNRSGIIHPSHNGTPASLVEAQRKAGVDYSVILNISTNPHQQRSVNNFAISLLDHEGVIPFGSVHPDSEDIFEELERLKEAGIKGIKFHPDYQDFFCDEERMIPVYEKIAQLGFVTVFHCGLDMGLPYPIHCSAQRLSRILPVFGGAPVVAAHFGGLADYENTMKYLCGKDVYLDTAYCFGTLPPVAAREIINLHGADKILMASDAPWNDPADSIAMVKHFGVPEADEKKILGLNAAKLLKI
jgi:predicted TIM-barrel fold metal-dependent hydrolase